MNRVRSFISIELNVTVKEALREFYNVHKSLSSNLRWTPIENIHLTVVFLGDQTLAFLGELYQIISPIVARFDPIRFAIRGGGYFGTQRKPRVFWLGLEDTTKQMYYLNEKLNECARRQGVVVEDRVFRPHLTIARPKSHVKIEVGLASAWLKACDVFGPIETEARVVSLIESQLGGTASQYKMLYQAKLGVIDKRLQF